MGKEYFMKVLAGTSDGMTIAVTDAAEKIIESFYLTNKAAMELVGEINNHLNRNK